MSRASVSMSPKHGAATAAAASPTSPAANNRSSKTQQQIWVLKQTEPIEHYYKLGRRLGQPGQFGHAVQAQHLKTGKQFAVKVISKSRFTRLSDIKYHYEQLRSEISVMSRMSHPNIIKLYEVYESVDTLFLVLELCLGSELFDRIKQNGAYSEKDAAAVARQMCAGIKYMHENGIAHCDLKASQQLSVAAAELSIVCALQRIDSPDNFLFLSPAPDAPLKIIDFGMSKFVQRRKYFKQLCGTPYYVAPEVIVGKYSEHADLWSLGVVLFVMLFGYPPFYCDEGPGSDEKIFKLIQSGFQAVTKPGYGNHFPQAIPCSSAAKDLISKLLTRDIARRLTAAEALEHEWLTGKAASDLPILANVVTNIKSFQATAKLKQAVLNMMSHALSDDEVQTLKKTFVEIDANKDGTITMSELQLALSKLDKDGKQSMNVDEITALFKAADLDGSGSLSYDELLLTCVHKKISAKEERIYQAFSAIDVNGDGKLSAEELSSVLTGNDLESAKALIAEVDRDGDGNISYEEFSLMWQNQAIEQAKNQLAKEDRQVNGTSPKTTLPVSPKSKPPRPSLAK